ncbi:cell death in tomato 1 [Cucurbitaria berberidis CBS 394.84]|uniref:Cell death in tomato 1 n=1 Tax=Cucurbitaria berberidis CBS 394.84 TaxID=1168544 RepID=A0A9P4LEB9_9PLEO|nr:cell death in tomato 1 [Cucurbitaria berberidis CBS 394.84]KAF1851723.1 cell death in tomato 1 [Cucurbitaria berberidis CBS 394.84]
MRFTTLSLATILALTSSASAAPQASQKQLQDWQVTAVGVFTPSGRPGSYPWATIRANVTDPNEINLGPAKSDGSNVIVPGGSQGINCEAKWFTKGESPLGRTWPCDAVSNGYWTLTVLAGSQGFSPTDFKLRFTHVADVLYQGAEYTGSFKAVGSFKVGDNLSGTCGGSGVCVWGLAAGKNPVLIKPTKQ